MTELSGWVLILWMFTGHGGGPTTAVFYTKAACEAAAQAAISGYASQLEQWGGGSERAMRLARQNVRYVCVRDGSD